MKKKWITVFICAFMFFSNVKLDSSAHEKRDEKESYVIENAKPDSFVHEEHDEKEFYAMENVMAGSEIVITGTTWVHLIRNSV